MKAALAVWGLLSIAGTMLYIGMATIATRRQEVGRLLDEALDIRAREREQLVRSLFRHADIHRVERRPECLTIHGKDEAEIIDTLLETIV